jgi:hypothetical protein
MLGMVINAYCPSYSGDRVRRITAQGKSRRTLSKKQKRKEKELKGWLKW